MPNQYIEQSKNKRNKKRSKDFYYTSPEMVKNLIALLPLKENDYVLDAGSGINKIWFNSLPNFCQKDECEIEDGCDFLKENNKYDYVIGNPPFSLGWKFLEHASQISRKGIAFLGNINFFNSLTPKRLQQLKDNGFELQHIRVVSDVRWFGRYLFLIFTKKPSKFVSWNLKSY